MSALQSGSDELTGGIPMGVCYRTGKLTVADYDEAIRDLTDARNQVASGCLMGCACCGDSGHAVQDGCHHDPLYLARQWAAATHVWECWHCGYTATNAEQAEAHFGKTEFEVAACIAAHREAHTAGLAEALAALSFEVKCFLGDAPVGMTLHSAIEKADAALAEHGK